jgi:peptidoglycan-associated lipoprotein
MAALKTTCETGVSLALTVVFALALSGCATQQPVVKKMAEETPPPPKEEPKPEPPKPLEFEKVYYDYNKADLKDSGKETLKRAVDALLARPEAKINVEGNCDERGTDEYNMELGWKRAYGVRDYLKKLGVDESRLFPISYGRSRPAVAGTDESSWSKNRRVELSERK